MSQAGAPAPDAALGRIFGTFIRAASLVTTRGLREAPGGDEAEATFGPEAAR